MIEKRGENLETTPSNVIIAVSGVDHFRLTTLGTSTRRSIERARQPEAGPERVVDDEADVGGVGAGENVVEEVALGMGVVERRRDLDVVGPDGRRGLDEPDELERARRLAADRDRYPTGGRRDGSLPDRHALIEGHRREVAGRSAGEEDRVARQAAALDEELDMPRDRVEVDRQIRHRRGTSSGS